MSGDNPTVRELAVAASRGQQASPDAARALGWSPVGPSLLSELATGSYARQG